ncbi:hypothetical protein ONZ45_g18797 [Pleurotus djamor]|nr:hypothetical protein ONZ45_g18797 [Pleurotus djamor]
MMYEPEREYPRGFKNTRAIPDFIALDDMESERFSINDFVYAQHLIKWPNDFSARCLGRIVSIDIDPIHTTKEFTVAFADEHTKQVHYGTYRIWKSDRITEYEGDTRALHKLYAYVRGNPKSARQSAMVKSSTKDGDDDFPMRR